MDVTPVSEDVWVDVEQALASVARRQHGLITRAQAVAAGLTPSAIRVRTEKGSWILVRRKVYAVAGVAPSAAQAALAVCLASEAGRCWVSHRSAAALWGLKVAPSPTIDVVTPASLRINLDGVRQHRSKELFIADLTQHQLVPLTTVARTLADCVPYVPGRRLARAVDDAQRRGLLDIRDLADCAERLDHRGRRLLAPLRDVLGERLSGRQPGGSQRELGVLDILRAANMPLPVQQFQVVVGGRQRVLDYAYPAEKVGLEWDGFAEHGRIRSTFDDDRLRGNDLIVAGWLMLHFTSNTPSQHLVARTRAALDLRRSRPA